MGFLNSSRATGRISDSLKAAAQVTFVGHSAAGESGTVLTFRVPRFGDAAPDLYAQGRMWDDGPAAEATAFELLGSAVRDVAARRENSNRFDQSLLRHLGSYERLLNRGLSSIAIDDEGLGAKPRIDRAVVQTAHALSQATPPSRRVRVTGRLDLMGASQGVIKLHVRNNQIVTALWSGADPIERHHELFNREVVLEGLGIFRPSGTLLRIDADALLAATQQDEFFRDLPIATPARDYLQSAHLRAGEPSAYARLRGSVPAEESDEVFLAALDALR